ncbi:MAG: formylmethanofuran dehydrogenase subunit A [Planctomyces sp.]|nr:formylmethanofuran dehydrogenase subunit A [Planctomyces sp.]
MSRLLKIEGGTVYDPANGVDGLVADLWIRDGRIVAAPASPEVRPDQTFDARGYVIMPGGIDMHSHIAGPKVNSGRKMIPDMKRNGQTISRTAITRSGTIGPAPSTFATGYLYSTMGYTTAFDAAIPGLLARHAHEEFADTPQIDKGFYVLFGNNHYVMDRIRAQEQEQLDAYCSWMLSSIRGYTIKLVNPGGVESWKQISRMSIQQLDSPVPEFGVTPRDIVRELSATADRLALPHSVHIHCNNLGIPGNWQTTLHTMQSLEGHRGHFAHVQFHSYKGDPNDPRSFASAAPELVDYVKAHPNVTVDVGHVNPGKTLSMTGDAPFSFYLRHIRNNKWFAADCEQESSCGVIPIEYRPEKSLIHAVQWAIALEWYLLMDDPWRCAMTSDHPNGGAFYRYPEVIALLMDRELRRDTIRKLPHQLTSRTVLNDIDREYTLQEIAIITRAAPARILGLRQKGHLGVGADADITIYTPDRDRRKMFASARWVFKAGELVVDDGDICRQVFGDTHFVAPHYSEESLPGIEEWFQNHYTIQFSNYAISDDHFASLAAAGQM